jgi:tRNA modification GTPase
MSDTIAAIATAQGRGGIGVVRVSGKNLHPLIQAITGKECLNPRLASLCDFLDADGLTIDQGIGLFFPSPHSFTGEDVIEFQGHGGPVVLQMLLQRCLALGARLAEPGEFTQRAFLNDKLDLAQAESVADLIDAASVEAARCAVRSLRGDFSNAVRSLVSQLIDLRMLVEATLDFPDEEVDVLVEDKARASLAALSQQLNQVFESARQGALLREGVQVVLIGQPNVGKSSLLNQLAGEEVAIVTSIPGTTRDTIRQHILMDGVALHFIDTAGLRESADEIEKIGMARTWATISQANIGILMLDAQCGLTENDREIVERLPANLPLIRVFNKIDSYGMAPKLEITETGLDIHLSAKTGQGLEILRSQILKTVGWQHTGEGLYLARERHLEALRKASFHLRDAGENLHQVELFAEELRLAQESLSTITGEFTPDDLLGEIFSRFCIGK